MAETASRQVSVHFVIDEQAGHRVPTKRRGRLTHKSNAGPRLPAAEAALTKAGLTSAGET
jgi:hypothetical protein